MPRFRSALRRSAWLAGVCAAALFIGRDEAGAVPCANGPILLFSNETIQCVGGPFDSQIGTNMGQNNIDITIGDGSTLTAVTSSVPTVPVSVFQSTNVDILVTNGARLSAGSAARAILITVDSDNVAVTLDQGGIIEASSNGEGITATGAAGNLLTGLNLQLNGTIQGPGGVGGNIGVNLRSTDGALVVVGGTITTESGIEINGGQNNVLTIAAGGLITSAAMATEGIRIQDEQNDTIQIFGTVNVPNGIGVSMSLATNALVTVGAGGLVDAQAGIIGQNGTETVIVAGTVKSQVNFDAINLGENADIVELQPGFSITGAVNGGTGTDLLRFGGTGSATFDIGLLGQQYVEFEQIEKVGPTSVWLWSGTTAVNWPVTVTAGALLLNNVQMMNAPFTVNGGALYGTGTIGNLTVNAGGAVAPGIGAIGTLNVNGNVVFNAGSQYVVKVNAQLQADKIEATGTATINGGTVAAVTLVGNYPATGKWTILTAAGGVTNQFSGVTVAGFNPQFFTATLDKDANNVYLILDYSEPVGSTAFSGIALTPNQKAVAGTLDPLGVNAPFFTSLVLLSDEDIRKALDAMSGEIHATARGVALRPSNMFSSTLRDRAAGTFDEFGPPPGPVAYAAGAVEGLRGTVPDIVADSRSLGAGADLRGGLVPALAPARPPELVWMSVAGKRGLIEGDGNAATADVAEAGLFGGVDIPVAPDLRLGLAGGWSRVGIDVGTGRESTAKADVWHLGATAAAAIGDIRLRGVISYSGYSFETHRNVLIGGASVGSNEARYTTHRIEALAEAGYALNWGGTLVEPYVGLGGVLVNVGGFAESGAGAADLAANSQTDALPYTLLGVRLAGRWASAGMVLTPRVDLAWRHAFDNMTPQHTLGFVQHPSLPFTVFGTPIARNTLVVSAALDIQMSASMMASLRYRGEFGGPARLMWGNGPNGNAYEHTATANLIWHF